MGGAIHADDLRTTAASSDSVTEQDKSFTSDSCLRLNTSKFEAVKISPYTHETAVIQIGDSTTVSLLPKPQSVLEYGGTQTYLPNTPSLKMSTRPEKLSLLLEGLEHSRVT